MGRSVASVVPAAVLVALLACKGDSSTSPAPAGDTPKPAVATAAAPTPAVTPLAPGSAAPPFSLVGSDGKTHALADDAGKNVVVVAWFPKAFTGG